MIQPTSLCNLDCSYCYLPDRQRRHLLDPELITPILQRVLESPFLGPVLTILWHAGEPLTRPPAFYDDAGHRIRAAVRGHGGDVQVHQALQTNGTLLNPQWCECLRRNDITVGVSLDGPAFLHDRHRRNHRGLGSHAQTMRGIRHLQKAAIPFSVISVLSRESLDHADAIVDFLLENGISEVGFNMEETEGVHSQSSLEGEGCEGRYREFLGRVWDRAAASEGALRIREFEQILHFVRTDSRIDHTDLNHPMVIVSVDHQGNFSTFDPELLSVETSYGRFNLGHVLKDSLASACETEKFQRMWEDMRAGVEACRSSCAYFGICGGGAGSNKYWETGSLRATETQACRYRIQHVTDVALSKLEAELGLT